MDEHGRLIDADALWMDIIHSMDYCEDILEFIERQPTIEPERKTGKWIVYETEFWDTEAKWSKCGFVTLVNEPGNGLHMVSDLHFCPNCGSYNGGEQP